MRYDQENMWSNINYKYVFKKQMGKPTQNERLWQMFFLRKITPGQNVTPPYLIDSIILEKKMNFESENDNCNTPFNMIELKDSLNKSHNIATGPDEIQVLEAPTRKLLFKYYNEIWQTGNFCEKSYKSIQLSPHFINKFYIQNNIKFGKFSIKMDIRKT